MTGEREILFTPAFHRCSPSPSQDFGIGGVKVQWILRLDGWAMTWDVFTDWGLPDEAFKTACPDCTHPMHQHGYPSNSPQGGAVDWHSPVPLFDGQEPAHGDCKWVGGPCYIDTGYIIGDQLFDILRTKGSEAVWEWLTEALTERRDGLAVQSS